MRVHSGTLILTPHIVCDVQPLRDSLQIHSRLGRAVAARLLQSIAHPPASDRPGPLEAGHRRARSLILTPAECKRMSRLLLPPAAVLAAPEMAATAAAAAPSAQCGAAQSDLMIFSPDPTSQQGLTSTPKPHGHKPWDILPAVSQQCFTIAAEEEKTFTSTFQI